MPQRTTIRLDEIAARDHLAWAFWRAAQGKRSQPEVRAFAEHLDRELDLLHTEILAGTVQVGCFRRFQICDPKLRAIHAPCFRERVLHHALMAYVGPVIERYLVADTFACRPGKGSWAAVRRAQQHSRRWPWLLKLDICAYFASIDHAVLKEQIRRRIKGAGVLALIDRILDTHCTTPGRGLPIGALTSQYFANLYLAALDRYLLEHLHVGGLVRYMDDVVIWDRSRERQRFHLEAVRAFTAHRLRLEIKSSWCLQCSERGLTLCGFRLFPGQLRLSQRRQKRYRLARRRWEAAFAEGRIDARALQAGYAAALAVTAGAEAVAFRKRDLAARPPIDV